MNRSQTKHAIATKGDLKEMEVRLRTEAKEDVANIITSLKKYLEELKKLITSS